MANGDDAAAAGMDVVPGTADIRDSYDEHNKTRDYIAQRTSTVTPIAKGGTGATTAAAARANLGAQADLGYTPVRRYGGNVIQHGWTGDQVVTQVDSTTFYLLRRDFPADVSQLTTWGGTINSVGGTIETAGGPISTSGGPLTAGDISSGTAYNRNVSGGGVRALYVAADGRIGISTSSERYKSVIGAAQTDPLAVLALRPVMYHMLDELAKRDPTSPTFVSEDYHVSTYVGLIAEELHEAGLWQCVFYDEEGRPEGIHYELFSLAVLTAVQYVWEQHQALDARVAALEAARQ